MPVRASTKSETALTMEDFMSCSVALFMAHLRAGQVRTAIVALWRCTSAICSAQCCAPRIMNRKSWC